MSVPAFGMGWQYCMEGVLPVNGRGLDGTQPVRRLLGWKRLEGVVRKSTKSDMKAQDHVLNPVRFIDDFSPPESLDPNMVKAELEILQQGRDNAARRIETLIAALQPTPNLSSETPS